MIRNRILSLNKNYTPCPAVENDELYPNGIFVFNISTIIEHISSGQLVVEQEIPKTLPLVAVDGAKLSILVA